MTDVDVNEMRVPISISFHPLTGDHWWSRIIAYFVVFVPVDNKMSTVLNTPRYKLQALNKFKSYLAVLDKGSEDDVLKRRHSCAMDGLYNFRLPTYEIRDHDDDMFAYVNLLHSNVSTAENMAYILRAIDHKYSAYTWVSDDAAIASLLYLTLTGKTHAKPIQVDNFTDCECTASTMSFLGATAGLASPAPAFDKFKAIRPFSYLYREHPSIFTAYEYADCWINSSYNLSCNNAIRNLPTYNSNDLLDIARLRNTPLTKAYPNLMFYSVSDLLFVICQNNEGNFVYLLDDTAKKELTYFLRKPAKWLIYGAFYHDKPECTDVTATDISRVGVTYVIDCLRECYLNRTVFGEFASMMKTSYNFILAGLSSHAATKELQRNALVESINDLHVSPKIKPWYLILRDYPIHYAIDFGTIWSMYPAVDADLKVFDEALQEKLNAPREYSDDAWAEFTSYCAGVISAHICLKERSTDFIWSENEVPEWATICASGVLKYPPIRNKNRILHHMKWVPYMDTWYFDANDVTHVAADIKKYENPYDLSKLTKADTNELLFALKNAPNFSNGKSPMEVRNEWTNHSLDFDRVLYVAVKRENTKYGPKVRDTHSACDVLREILSEVDHNFTTLAHTIDGCATGKSRVSIERRLFDITNKAQDTDAFISVDVEGWSPNAPRKKHLEFVDFLLSFYEGNHTVSDVFTDLKIVNSRRGYHNVWTPKDGSIQGFFGTADTILHSLMIQWVFTKYRAEISKDDAQVIGTKVTKLVLIDDAVALIERGYKYIDRILPRFRHYYGLLGYKLDIIKTLVSNCSCHFLNRAYMKNHEVLSACKVFAKAEMTTELRFPTCWQLIDSIYTSYSSASDRGAAPFLSYYMANFATVQYIFRRTHNFRVHCTFFQFVGAWLPRSFGGLGLPNMTSWLTHTADHQEDDGFATLKYIHDLNMKYHIIPTVTDSFNKVLADIHTIEIIPPTVLGFIADPWHVRSKFYVDVSNAVSSAFRSVVRKMDLSSKFSQLYAKSTDSSYVEMLDRAVKASNWPAHVVKAWGDSLPHTILDSLLVKVYHSDVMASLMSYTSRSRTVKAVQHQNREALNAWTKYTGNLNPLEDPTIMGSIYLLKIRSENARLLNYTTTYLESASTLEGVVHTEQQRTMASRKHPSIKKIDDLYFGTPDTSMQRTRSSHPNAHLAVKFDRSPNPVLRSVIAMCRVASCCNTMGWNPVALTNTYYQAWCGTVNAQVIIDIEVGNMSRKLICAVTRKTIHTCRLFPNASKASAVSAHTIISMLEDIPKTFDWLSVICTIETVRAICIALGNFDNQPWFYTLNPDSAITHLEAKPVLCNTFDPGEVRGVLARSDTDNLLKFLSLVVESSMVRMEEGAGTISMGITHFERNMTPAQRLDATSFGNTMLRTNPISGIGLLDNYARNSPQADVTSHSQTPSVYRFIANNSETAQCRLVACALYSVYSYLRYILITDIETQLTEDIFEEDNLAQKFTNKLRHARSKMSLTAEDVRFSCNEWGETDLGTKAYNFITSQSFDNYKILAIKIRNAMDAGNILINGSMSTYYKKQIDICRVALRSNPNDVYENIKLQVFTNWYGWFKTNMPIARIFQQSMDLFATLEVEYTGNKDIALTLLILNSLTPKIINRSRRALYRKSSNVAATKCILNLLTWMITDLSAHAAKLKKTKYLLNLLETNLQIQLGVLDVPRDPPPVAPAPAPEVPMDPSMMMDVANIFNMFGSGAGFTITLPNYDESGLEDEALNPDPNRDADV
uniref:RNA-dependent RNA polymerase n=1 Tax=Zootermopsis nevadensis qinvirus 1 TaxID=3133546 RepID=A0AAT9JND3_9VIRU